MFRVTAIGHQGWLVGNDESRILVDPLLCDHLSRMPRSGTRVSPPRRFDFAAMPPLDALVITHEHPDHFDVASLQRIDRAMQVLVSAHMSAAARRLIRELGFSIRDLR